VLKVVEGIAMDIGGVAAELKPYDAV